MEKSGQMNPHDYQIAANEFLTDRLYVKGELGGGLFADPGLGKTLMTLMQIKTLRDLKEIRRVLVVAPLRPVYSVWPKEIEKWNYDFSYSILHGPSKVKRLSKDADLHIINPEGLAWLVKQNPLPEVGHDRRGREYFLQDLDIEAVQVPPQNAAEFQEAGHPHRHPGSQQPSGPAFADLYPG